MCDTVVVVTGRGVLFAKNSDRDANEGQHLDWQPARQHAAGSMVRCTYLTIPQVRRTHATLLSRPYWGFGAEIATNECGVTIGNEAVFTRTAVPKRGLTGMDLVRLAVERADSARGAVDVIVDLIRRYPQGGGCGHEGDGFRYFSSFLIADRHTAYVLETCGAEAAYEQILVGSAYAISNGLSLPGFADRHRDPLFSWASRCDIRRRRSLLHADHIAAAGRAQPHATSTTADTDEARLASLMALLRDHGTPQNSHGEPQHYSPLTGALYGPCVHGAGVLGGSQTTASWVALLSSQSDRHYVTATAAPCTSIFKPVAVGTPLSADVLGPTPQDTVEAYGPPSLFWQHERLHRAVMRDPHALLPLFRAERDALEARFLSAPPDPADAFREAALALARWTARVDAALHAEGRARGTGRSVRPALLERYWQTRNEWAGLTGRRRRSFRPPWRGGHA